MCKLGENGVFEITIGEIVEANEAEEGDSISYGYKMENEKVIEAFPITKFDKHIVVQAKNRDGRKKKWYLNIEQFLPFYSNPGFEKDKNRDTRMTLYSTMAFWFDDHSFAANFVHNMSNRKLSQVMEIYQLDEDEMQSFFLSSDYRRNYAEDASFQFPKKTFVTLKSIMERGDLSFAPTPNVQYKHKKTSVDLSLAVINRMKVMFLLLPTPKKCFPTYLTLMCLFCSSRMIFDMNLSFPMKTLKDIKKIHHIHGEMWRKNIQGFAEEYEGMLNIVVLIHVLRK